MLRLDVVEHPPFLVYDLLLEAGLETCHSVVDVVHCVLEQCGRLQRQLHVQSFRACYSILHTLMPKYTILAYYMR